MNKSYDVLIKDIQSTLDSIYLIYGEEQYLVNDVVKRIKKQFGELVNGINFISIDNTNIDGLISDIETPAFGYDKKLIIIRNSELFKKDGRRKSLTPSQEKIYDYICQKDNQDFIKENLVLVFVELSADKNSIYDEISKIGTVCEIKELTQNDLIKRLGHICGLYKVKVDTQALQHLIERSGTNLEVLMNEIRKLIEYEGEGGTIKISDIDNLSIKQFDSEIFDLTDNLATKKMDKALNNLDELIYQKVELLVILKSLYTHFKKLYLCKQAMKNNQNIGLALNLKPNQTFLVNKYRNQLRYFDENSLRKLLDELVELDYNFKTSKIDLEIGLRSILCAYCS